MTLSVGDQAPDFTLETAAGPVSLADFAGRRLLLYFYPKDDTSGCTSQAIQFSEALEQYRAAGIEILGVSKDSLKSHAKFTDKHGLKIRLASDPEGQTVEAYGAWVEKSMYGRKYMGIDRSSFLIGPDGRIQAIWRKVKVPGHIAAILKEAASLG